MKLRDKLISKIDAALGSFRKSYRGGPQVYLETVETEFKGQRHCVTILIQMEQVCEANQERRENAALN